MDRKAILILPLHWQRPHWSASQRPGTWGIDNIVPLGTALRKPLLSSQGLGEL